MYQSRQRWSLPALALFAVLCGSMEAGAEEPGRSPQEWLTEFSRQWQEDDWTVSFRPVPDGYMRPRDDADWKTRMLALQAFVKTGKDAVPVLLDALKTGDDPQRILAAQALGYLAPHVPHEPLLHAAQSDKNPAVRLYAVDSLGMQGGAHEIDWDALLKAETHR
ncbi:MAG: HEAT repeat domain-containing protein, partial [Planctomycetaceae bacterium]